MSVGETEGFRLWVMTKETYVIAYRWGWLHSVLRLPLVEDSICLHKFPWACRLPDSKNARIISFLPVSAFFQIDIRRLALQEVSARSYPCYISTSDLQITALT